MRVASIMNRPAKKAIVFSLFNEGIIALITSADMTSPPGVRSKPQTGQVKNSCSVSNNLKGTGTTMLYVPACNQARICQGSRKTLNQRLILLFCGFSLHPIKNTISHQFSPFGFFSPITRISLIHVTPYSSWPFFYVGNFWYHEKNISIIR